MDENIYGDDGLIIDDDPSADIPEEEILKFRKPKHFRKKKRILIFALILLAVAVITVSCFGVYKLFFEESDVYDDSVAYYFTSDLLREEGAQYHVIDSIDFNLYNFAGELRVSKEKIEDFEITIKADGEDITDDVTITVGEKAMEADVRSTCAVSVELPEKYMGKTVTVTAVSKPIEITLRAKFTVTPEWSCEIIDSAEDSYSVTEDGVWVKTVLSAEKKVTLKVEWDSEQLIPNISDEYILSYMTDEGQLIIPLEVNSSITLDFFKTEAYKDSSAIKVTENEKDVDVKNNDTKEEVAE